MKHYGVGELFTRMHEKRDSAEISYAEFCKQEKLSAGDLDHQRRVGRSWSNKPLISVVCVTEQGINAQKYLSAMLASQTYDHYDWFTSSSFADGIKGADGDYLAFVEYKDVVSPSALYEVASVVLGQKGTRQSGLHWGGYHCSPDLIYTDEDQDEDHQMKPDFSPAMLEETCYIKHLLVVSRELARKALQKDENFNQSGSSGITLERFARACANQAQYIYHIPKVLYHQTVKGNLPEQPGYGNVNYGVLSEETRPLISIIIPNKDQRATLETCLNSIRNSTYPRYEIIVVENNSTTDEIFEFYQSLSDVKLVTWESSDKSFNFSAINNYGVSCAKGNYLVFLNNDIEIITSDWLERLLADCERPNTAIAGAKLYYPDDTVQHAGIVIGIGGHARGIGANMCVGLDRFDPGYMNRASIRQNMSAVTAACMMMRRDVFEKIGGYTEKLTVAFNDVDLCLKARKAGYEIIYDPYVEAYHYESKSRGMEDTAEKVRRFQAEIEYMRTEWEDILKEGDPYYNPNLSRYRFDYSLRRGK